jgi:5-methylcytosine-specific restriction endonuclease McrA
MKNDSQQFALPRAASSDAESHSRRGDFPKMNRKPIGKKLRFEIFTRDGFTCRYCGRQSDIVPLHIDHVMPVCQGGTNDPENLVTSCSDCNLGKGGRTIPQSAPNETDRLRMAQEMQEQIAASERAKASAQARRHRMEAMLDFWEGETGGTRPDPSTTQTVFSYVLEYGEEIVYRWIEKASAVCYTDRNMGRYISGIRRSVKAEEGEQ